MNEGHIATYRHVAQLRERDGAAPRTRYLSIPCACCKEDTTHYVGKCIHCKTVNVVIPDIKPKKFLYGRRA